MKLEYVFTLVPDRYTRRHSLRPRRNHTRIQMRVKLFINRVNPLWKRLKNMRLIAIMLLDFKKPWIPAGRWCNQIQGNTFWV